MVRPFDRNTSMQTVALNVSAFILRCRRHSMSGDGIVGGVHSQTASRSCRRDLGSKGSFGGKTSRDERLRNQPIVFVHGVSDTAGEKMQQAARWFKWVRELLSSRESFSSRNRLKNLSRTDKNTWGFFESPMNLSWVLVSNYCVPGYLLLKIVWWFYSII